MNYPLIKVKNKGSQQFKSNLFASSFTQEVSTFAENCNNNYTIFENYFAMDGINVNVNLTNEIKLYSMLIEIFNEMTNHLEGYCTVNDTNEIRAYVNNKIVKAKKRAADNLKLFNIE